MENTTVNVPELLTAKEAAEVFGVKTATLYGWVCKRKIRHYRLGRKHGPVRFSKTDIARFLEERATEAI